MNLVEMSVLGSILIIGIIILRALLIHQLPKQIWVTLWMVAMIRLLIPIVVPLNIPSLVQEGSVVSNIKELQNATNVQGNPIVDSPAEEESRINDRSLVWLFGILFITCYMMRSYIRDKKLLKEAIPETRFEEYFKEISRGRILVSDRIKTPITYGIFKQVIILPKEIDLSNKELLEYVLLHERVHMKYHDNLFKLIALVTVCVHWYNPLVWIMWVFCQRDLELRCDEQVLRAVGTGNRKEYALTLLRMAEQNNSQFSMGVGFGKRAIKERMEAIMKYKKVTIISTFVAAIVITASLTTFITAEAHDSVEKSKEYVVEASETNGDDKAYTVNKKIASESSKERETSTDTVVQTETNAKLTKEMKQEIQLHADRFAEYGVSVVIEDADYQLYYGEEPICFVADNQATDGSFSGSVIFNADHGKKGAVTIRNGKGELTGMKLLSEEETKEYNEKFWL